MKKIIVAICGIILSGGAYAAITEVSGSIKENWSFALDNPKTNIISKYDIHGNDFQSVDIAVAVEIYEHGAKFCRIQLQHNWNKWDTWVAPESCRTICKNNFYGDGCRETKVSDCEFKDFSQLFDKSAKPSPYKNQTIDGFYVSPKGSKARDVVLLEIVSKDKNSVVVAPVEFFGADSDYKKITAINRRGEEIKLCAQGYELKDGQCVLTSVCADPLINLDWCGSWDGYAFNEDYHETIKVNSCKQYRCKNSNEGFDGLSTKRCISCGETKKSGVLDNGVCKKCNTGQVFDKDELDGCKEASNISREKLLNGIYNVGKCWMKSSPSEYKSCVRCDKGQKWDDLTELCE